MKKKGLWFGFAVLLLVVLWPASAVLADGPTVYLDGGQIFVEEDVILEPGEVFDGDLGVFDGDLGATATWPAGCGATFRRCLVTWRCAARPWWRVI